MPSPKEFHRTLDLLSQYVSDIGDEVRAEEEPMYFDEDDEDNNDAIGHRCSDGESLYVVVAHPNKRYMIVEYSFSFVYGFSRELDDNLAEYLTGNNYADQTEQNREAVEILLNQIDEGEMQSVKNHLLFTIGGQGQRTKLHTNSSNSLTGFSVRKYVFPYESSFTIHEFAQAVDSVLSVGPLGNVFLSNALRLTDGEDVEQATLELDDTTMKYLGH